MFNLDRMLDIGSAIITGVREVKNIYDTIQDKPVIKAFEVYHIQDDGTKVTCTTYKNRSGNKYDFKSKIE